MQSYFLHSFGNRLIKLLFKPQLTNFLHFLFCFTTCTIYFCCCLMSYFTFACFELRLMDTRIKAYIVNEDEILKVFEFKENLTSNSCKFLKIQKLEFGKNKVGFSTTRSSIILTHCIFSGLNLRLIEIRR